MGGRALPCRGGRGSPRGEHRVVPPRAVQLNQTPQSFSKELYGWYWDQGNALYLSHHAAALLMKSWPKLKNGSDEEVREHFSSIRTQLKIDCGVISEKEAKLGVMPKDGEEA